jgi:branched-chain amino acid transport system substrate-binding protein
MAVLTAAALAATSAACAESGSSGAGGGGGDTSEPIVVGSTLSLTGPFAATGAIHKIAGEQFVARLNAQGGLLGRQVQWKVLDDQSDQAKVGQLYEQLITQDGVDLIMGPYATPNILSAMTVAERHGYVLPQHTAVLAPLMTYSCQFPAWSIGPTPNRFVPEMLFDAVATLPNPPKKIAVLTSQNGSAAFVTDGHGSDKTGVLTVAKERGLDVVVNVHYPPTITDWGPIAAQVRDAKPDLVINNGLGVDTVNALTAMKQLGYRPPLTFSLFPAPGPLLGLGEDGEGVISTSVFEPNKAVVDKLPAETKAIVDEFTKRATDAKQPYPVFETQAAASWTAWEILAEAVKGVGKIDHKAMCDWLHSNGANTTFNGKLTFDPKTNNFWPSTLGLKQIQNKEWTLVWPEDRAAAKLAGPAAG